MTGLEQVPLTLETSQRLIRGVRGAIMEQIFGQEELIDEALCSLLAGGHILITGAPGLGKTTLVRVFSEHFSLKFGRIQFTPDLLPSDILGSEVLNIDASTGKKYFEFSPGPVFVNLLLTDEINRASPRTQSALLEAMQERFVTISGVRYPLSLPFMVFATQNPFESEGTFPLPEAQLDRFLIHAFVKYPDQAGEEAVLSAHALDKLVGEKGQYQVDLEKKVTIDQLQKMNALVKEVHIEKAMIKGISSLIRATRPEDKACPPSLRDSILYGAGPRAGISLISVARAWAFLKGDKVLRWKHVKRMVLPVLHHRLRLKLSSGNQEITIEEAVSIVTSHIENMYSKLIRD